jgi:hypothetical protein
MKAVWYEVLLTFAYRREGSRVGAHGSAAPISVKWVNDRTLLTSKAIMGPQQIRVAFT